MKVITSYRFNAKPEKLWPLLFSSKMDDKQPCYFLCGLSKPVACRLKDEKGGVGSTRECVSDKGVITQEILKWEPSRCLQFRLKETDIFFGPCVKSIIENFEIAPEGESRSVITRTTEFTAVRGANSVLSIPMFIGLKAIHRYVFKNWKRLAA